MDNEVHFQGLKVFARICIVLTVCGLLFVGIRAAYSHSLANQEDGWTYECVDCPKYFMNMTDRSIRLDSSGHPRVAYGGDHLYFAWFDGSDWNYETADSSPGVGEFAALALDSNGYAHISYFDAANSDLKYAYQDVNGWHIETVYSDGQVGMSTSIDVDSDNYPHISFIDGTYSLLKYAYKDAGGWHIEDVGASDYGSDTSISLDQNGYPHISYTYFYNVSYAYKDAGGWQTSQISENGDFSSLALDSNDSPHVSFTDYSTGNLKYAHQELDNWIIETVDISGLNASIALDASDYPHISYKDGFSANLNYAYKDVVGWHIETVDGLDWVPSTSIALDASGNPHISYHDASNEDMKHAYYDLAGWHAEVLDAGGSVPDFDLMYPAPVVDADSTVHVSYFHQSDQSLKYAHRVEGAWQIETIEDNLYYLGSHSAMDIDSQGYAHISYFYPNSFDLKYAYQDVNGWHLYTVDSTGNVGGYSSLFLDANDYPHISYFADWPNYDLKYAYQDASGWHIEIVDSAGYVGQYTSIASDHNGYPHISYYDGDPNYDLKYAYQDASGWHTQTIFSDGYAGLYTSLVLDDDDHPHISFNNFFEDLYYTYKDESGWHAEVVDSQDQTGLLTSIALNSSDMPTITYLDYTNGDIKYAIKGEAGWTITTIDHVGSGKSSQAIDALGNIHLIYYHGLNRDLMYAVNLASIVSPTQVTISGPESGMVDASYTFTGTVEPISTTLPIEFVWQATGMSPITHTGGLTDTITFFWVTPGLKTIQVAASNPGGTVTDTHTVTLTDVPITELFAVNNSPTILGEATLFTATVEGGTNISYAWDFGDGALAEGSVVQHVYASPGEYAAIVTATNSINVLTTTTTVLVDQLIEGLSVSIEDATVKVGEVVEMRADVAEGSNVVYEWDFGDGSTASGQEVTHVYLQEGEYAVSVTATNSVDSATADATIFVTPAGFPIYLPMVTKTD